MRQKSKELATQARVVSDHFLAGIPATEERKPSHWQRETSRQATLDIGSAAVHLASYEQTYEGPLPKLRLSRLPKFFFKPPRGMVQFTYVTPREESSTLVFNVRDDDNISVQELTASSDAMGRQVFPERALEPVEESLFKDLLVRLLMSEPDAGQH